MTDTNETRAHCMANRCAECGAVPQYRHKAECPGGPGGVNDVRCVGCGVFPRYDHKDDCPYGRVLRSELLRAEVATHRERLDALEANVKLCGSAGADRFEPFGALDTIIQVVGDKEIDCDDVDTIMRQVHALRAYITGLVQ